LQRIFCTCIFAPMYAVDEFASMLLTMCVGETEAPRC
jgi:hypothetical protein